jgi:hypothetical protein
VLGINPYKFAVVFAKEAPFFFHEKEVCMDFPLEFTVEVNENVSLTHATAGLDWIEIDTGIESITTMRLILDN